MWFCASRTRDGRWGKRSKSGCLPEHWDAYLKQGTHVHVASTATLATPDLSLRSRASNRAEDSRSRFGTLQSLQPVNTASPRLNLSASGIDLAFRLGPFSFFLSIEPCLDCRSSLSQTGIPLDYPRTVVQPSALPTSGKAICLLPFFEIAAHNHRSSSLHPHHSF
jgi:hypothetical protein